MFCRFLYKRKIQDLQNILKMILTGQKTTFKHTCTLHDLFLLRSCVCEVPSEIIMCIHADRIKNGESFSRKITNWSIL